MAANSLLYFGPLLAGLAGFGWALVPVFTVIFVLWLIILQPYEFPINRAEWMSADAWVSVSARAAVQLLFVVVLFGIGRGIGGVLGALPRFSVTLPLAISFLSIPLARMVWDPWAQPPVPPMPPVPPAHPTLNSDVRVPVEPDAPMPDDPPPPPDVSKPSPP